jgi:hypothetical protein
MRVSFLAGVRDFLFSVVCGDHPAYYPMILGPLSLVAKREAIHPPSCSGDIKIMWNPAANPTYMLKGWCLIKGTVLLLPS